MVRIVVITSGKGGVGKTTTTANIGCALAKLGKKVVVLDADVSLRNLDLVLGLENRIVYNAFEVLNKKCRLDQALVKDKRNKNLFFLPIGQSQLKNELQTDQMRAIIELLVGKADEGSSEFDFILIDCPAGVELGFKTAIVCANEALIVTTPEIAAVRAADKVIGILYANSINKINLVVNRSRRRMVLTNNMMSLTDVQDILSIPLLGNVAEDERVVISVNKGEPLTTERKLSRTGQAFTRIAQNLLANNKVNSAEKTGFFRRLSTLYTSNAQKDLETSA